MGAADFGTKVHKMIADEINGKAEPDYRAEVSGIKSRQAEAKYGTKGSIRIDAFENLAEISTACIYDPKTGERGLSLPRMLELAQTAYRLFKSKQIIVIEVRPTQYVTAELTPVTQTHRNLRCIEMTSRCAATRSRPSPKLGGGKA